MAFIRWIEDDVATDQVSEVYARWKAANPGRERMPDILKCFSLRPDLLKAVVDFTYPLHFADGYLNRQTKEMIATFVSGLNQCRY